MEHIPGGFGDLSSLNNNAANNGISENSTVSSTGVSLKSRIQRSLVKYLSFALYYPIAAVYYIFFTIFQIKSICAVVVDRLYVNKKAGDTHESQIEFFLQQSSSSGLDVNETYSAPWLCHSYSELVDQCTREGKFQFVFIQSTLLKDHQTVTANVVKHLTPLLAKYSGSLWMGDLVTNTEALQVADMFKVKHCPVLAVFYTDNGANANPSNSSSSGRNMKKLKMIYKMEGEKFLKQNAFQCDMGAGREVEPEWVPRLKSKLNEHYSHVILYNRSQHQHTHEQS